MPENYQQLDPDLVNQFVLEAHRNLGEVQRLLQEEPGLLHAKWNWDGGDWESALGAAAHTGQREIALYLIDQGAPIDLFAAAMLGELTIVQAICEAYPDMKDAKGAHGIPLLFHAKAGGEHAEEVVRYLESLE